MIPRNGKRLLLATAWMTLAAPIAFSQTNPAQSAASPAPANAAALPAFEVVSIKPDTSNTGILMFNNTPDGFNARGFTVQMLIRAAYGYDDNLISGAPNWLNSEHYTLEAKVAGSDVPALARMDPAQRNLMLQPLLADRFQFKFHRETKQLPVFALVIAKNGLKLKQSPPANPGSNGPQMKMSARGQLTGQRFPISLLAQWLSLQVSRKVLDNTGLTGTYDFTLEWTPDSPASMSAGAETPAPDSGPSIFTAIQEQLGLKVESARGPVPVLVIDHLEEPTEN